MRKTPFKFLDAYTKKDINIFFGRADETRKLYEALSGVKHLLVYGPSGAGKTSLIECGLRNEFSNADWFALTIRRGNNINASVYASINKYLQNKIELEEQTGLPIDSSIHFETITEQLFNERYKPVYLLFDQFEELLISGSKDEQINFFTRLNQLIRYRVPCRVLLIMREEFIGYLSEFEKQCPTIFQHRFRLEKMRRDDVQKVIQQTLIAPRFANDFEVKDSEILAQAILTKLPDQVRQIELTHVQVFLNELWERAVKQTTPDAQPILHQDLIQKDDNLQRILDSFLKKQLQELAPIHGNQLPLEVLACMISERHTKLQLTAQAIEIALTANEIQLSQPLTPLLQDLQARKIIREFKQNEQATFEITHDILALAVGQNLTEEMQLRDKAIEIYRVYSERQGYFSQEDLDYLRPFEQYKAYPLLLQKRINKSEAFNRATQEKELKAAKERAEKEQKLRTTAETNATRAKQRTRIAIAVAVVALIATFFAVDQRTQAVNANEGLIVATQAARDSARVAQEQREFAQIQQRIAQDSAEVAQKQRTLAQREKLNAQKSLQNMIAAQEARVQEVRKRINAERKNIENKIEKIKLLLSAQSKKDTIEAKKIIKESLKVIPNHPELIQLNNQIKN